jgi:hypothetical protein
MDLTQKITRDINQFKSVPSSQNSGTSISAPTPSGESSGWSISSIFTPYTIGIVVVILLMFGAWFAWDWYKTHHKSSESKETSTTKTPIGGSTVKPVTETSTTTPTSTIPPVVTTMSPVQYAKYQKDQKALETALGTSNNGGGGGEPLPDDAAAGVGKAGWCYIGEDQGYGVCASVQQNDKCMSGQVYPTESECRQK